MGRKYGAPAWREKQMAGPAWEVSFLFIEHVNVEPATEARCALETMTQPSQETRVGLFQGAVHTLKLMGQRSDPVVEILVPIIQSSAGDPPVSTRVYLQTRSQLQSRG